MTTPEADRPAEAPDPIDLARRCRREGPTLLPDGRVAAWRRPWTLVIREVPAPFPRPKERS